VSKAIDVVLSAHAQRVIREREIELTWVRRIMNTPDRREPDKVDAALSHALGRVPERGGRVLRVVYYVTGEEAIVVTAYFDRSQRNKL
jgi:hypothetical protein